MYNEINDDRENKNLLMWFSIDNLLQFDILLLVYFGFKI